ncbi:MAG: hypothetical protein ACD_28C00395G0005 [uncultured bacterium]|nr:MAG: hypothetical protein ACD_28C00395G0005 [uncultured bacterium]KKT74307.1 MAG: hypothetical protein UW70_C0059G0008 [Candidatus Peregrinibacteria bacterium GW2011_GWA2_44_7]
MSVQDFFKELAILLEKYGAQTPASRIATYEKMKKGQIFDRVESETRGSKIWALLLQARAKNLRETSK